MKENKEPYLIDSNLQASRDGLIVYDEKDSVAERIKLAEKLKSIGVVQMDKRIHKKK